MESRELWVLAIALALLCLGITIANGGGLTQKVSQNLGLRDGIVRIYNEGGIPIEPAPEYVYEMLVGNTTLVFKDIQQISEARDFFSKKLRPPTAGGNPPYEHYWHPWFGRLPKEVLKKTVREKIYKALDKFLANKENT